MINEIVAPLPLPMGSGVSNDELHVRMHGRVDGMAEFLYRGFPQAITNIQDPSAFFRSSDICDDVLSIKNYECIRKKFEDVVALPFLRRYNTERLLVGYIAANRPRSICCGAFIC